MSISYFFAFLNLPAIICVFLISLLNYGLGRGLGKSFYESGDLILPMNLLLCSMYSVHALANLADASQIGPWLAFMAVSIFWASLLQISLKFIALKKALLKAS